MLKNLARTSAATLLALSALVACATVPVTGRKQFNLIPEVLMNQLGSSAYQSTLAESKVEKKTEDAQTIKQVGQRIAKVANQKDYDWEFKLLDDNDTVNAWCLPGGKIAVYTGILPVMKNEAGLAFVTGHEVGHAVAHHGAERLSQQLAIIGGMGALNLYLQNKSELSKDQINMILAALGVGAEVGLMLPFSRSHEKEADVIGMMYMARAGYPPSESIEVWDRMEKMVGGNDLAWLSTHPSNEQRQKNLKEWLPQAKKKYARAQRSGENPLATIWTSDSFPSSGGGKKKSGNKSSNDSGSSGGNTGGSSDGPGTAKKK